MRKWWVDPISIGSSAVDGAAIYTARDQKPLQQMVEYTRVTEVEPILAKIHEAVQLMAEGSHGACVTLLCDLKKTLESK